MMDKEATFLDAIRNNPEDRLAFSVYSDWLEEQGEEARADFLRLHFAMKRLPPDHPHRVDGEHELSFYRKDIDQEWLKIIEPGLIPPEDEQFRWQKFCDCLDASYGQKKWTELELHREAQDTECDAWKLLLDIIETAAKDGREEFQPFREMPAEYRLLITTLPPTIAKLRKVKYLNCYRSYLSRIPPEIGEMQSLERFDPYTSYKLHWFPFEITRCQNLKDSTVSTRAIYGNYKYRPPFPRLRPWVTQDNEPIGLKLKQRPVTFERNCSVCDKPFEDLGHHRYWISLRVATDVLPLLVNACSQECIDQIPQPPEHYVQHSHRGGLEIPQPKGTDVYD